MTTTHTIPAADWTQPARTLIPELVLIDREAAAMRDAFPAENAPAEAFDAWRGVAQAASEHRAHVEDTHRPMLCWKCHGTGTTPYKNRSHGVCYACRGDGWSARGRRTYRQQVTG